MTEVARLRLTAAGQGGVGGCRFQEHVLLQERERVQRVEACTFLVPKACTSLRRVASTVEKHMIMVAVENNVSPSIHYYRE